MKPQILDENDEENMLINSLQQQSLMQCKDRNSTTKNDLRFESRSKELVIQDKK